MKRRSVAVVVGGSLAVVFLVVGVAFASADPYAGDIPHGVDIGEALPIQCEEPEFGVDPLDALECDELVNEDGNVDMEWGASTNTGIFWQWRGDPDSGFWLQLGVDRGAANYYGPTSGNALICADVGGTAWASKYVPERAIAGGISSFDHPAGARLFEASGTLNAYLFLIADYTYSDPQVDCEAADPGEPAVGPSSTPFITFDPVSVYPTDAVEISLQAADHDGEDVTCVVQYHGSFAGTVAAGELIIEAAATFADEGLYGVECVADDGVFDDTEPEVGEVRAVLKVGAGLDNVIGEDCGSWMNIGCHFAAAMKWAFVPDTEVLYEMWDAIEDATEGRWPLGPLVSSIGVIGSIVVDFGRGMEDPLWYGVGTDCRGGSTAEACETGICVSCTYSVVLPDGGGGASALAGVVPLGGGLDLPEFRILAAGEEGSGEETVQTIVKGLIGMLLVFGIAGLMIRFAGAIMNSDPGQMSFNFTTRGGE